MSLPPRHPLLTARLALRTFEEGDLDTFHAMRDDPWHARYVPYAPASKEQVAKVHRQRMKWTALGARDSAITLAVVGWASRVFVGDMLLFHHEPDQASAELGFALDRAYEGKGYATEAARAGASRAAVR